MEIPPDEDWQKLVQQLERIVSKEHWLGDLIKDLVAAFAVSDEISFHQVVTLVAQAKQVFEMDLATARRMYRLYPKLVAGGQPQDHPRSQDL